MNIFYSLRGEVFLNPAQQLRAELPPSVVGVDVQSDYLGGVILVYGGYNETDDFIPFLCYQGVVVHIKIEV